MSLFNKKTKVVLSRAESLACRPIKSDQVSEDRLEGGEVVLTFPIAPHPFFAGLYRRSGVLPGRIVRKKLQLDRLGTSVWDLLDGQHTVRKVIDLFAEQHNLQHREAEVSVTQFLHSLGKRGLIGLG